MNNAIIRLLNTSITPILSVLIAAAIILGSTAVSAKKEGGLAPGMVNPGYEEKPSWFKVSFLDLYEDMDDASDEGKRLMLYFYQDGCPYCKKLLEDNFGQREIAETTQAHFDVVAINIWGDQEITVGDKVYTEKQFAEALKVQYTPTFLFFGEDRKAVFRTNGYYPPEKFTAVLDYVGQRMEKDEPFQDYLAGLKPEKASGVLHTSTTTIADSKDLSKALDVDRYLLVMLEQQHCLACDELHLDILKREESRELLKKLDVVVLDMWSDDKIVTPAGDTMKIRDWARKLDIKYAPSLLYFDASGGEVFRADGYLKAFHTQTGMDYVTSGSYLSQPNFQRFVDARADHLREQGIEVDLMR